MKQSVKWIILSSVVMSMLGVSAIGYVRLHARVARAQTAQLAAMTRQTETVTQPQPQPASTSASATKQVEPVSIAIPFLHVEAPIQPVGLDHDGRMATIPSPHVIAWYDGGASPGQPGNAILAGHRDWNGVLGTFWKLETLPLGSEVSIRFANGQTKWFTVRSNHNYPADAVPASVMEQGAGRRLTVITCVGEFIRSAGGYQSRVVVELQLSTAHVERMAPLQTDSQRSAAGLTVRSSHR